MSYSIKKFEAFGWVLAHCTMKAGDSYEWLVVSDKPWSRHKCVALYLHGRVEPRNHTTRGTGPARVPGTLISKLPTLERGRYSMLAVEDSEWLCMDLTLNAGMRPETDVLHVEVGQSVTIPAGQRVVVAWGSGTLDGVTLAMHDAVQPQATTQFVALSDTYLLLLDSSRLE